MRITKDPKIRRQEIIDTAARMFEEHGVGKTSVSEIAARLQVAKGLVYYYFDSKEILVTAVIEQLTQKLDDELARIVTRTELGFHDKLKTILHLYFSAIQNHPDLLSMAPTDPGLFALLRDKMSDTAFRHVAEILQAGIRQGLITIEYPDLVLKILIKGLGDLYIDGIRDPDIHATLIEQALGLEKNRLKGQPAGQPASATGGEP